MSGKSAPEPTNIMNIEAILPMLEDTGLSRNPQVADELKKRYNFDVKRPPTSVPMETGIAIQRYAAQYLYPDVSLTVALWKLGRVTFDSYRRSIVGKVMLAALPIWGPHRLMTSAPRVYEMTLKYGVRTVKKVGPTKYEFRHQKDSGNIEMVAGIAEASLEATGAKNVRVSIRTLALGDHILDIEWDE